VGKIKKEETMKKDMEKGEMEKLLKTIEGHPLTKKIMAEKAAEVLVKRRAAAEAIGALKKEQAENLPMLQEDLKIKEAKYLKAKAALDATLGELQTIKAARSSESYQFDNVIREHEEVLYETADPLIDETIQFFGDKLDWLRKPGRISRIGRPSEKNLFIWTKTVEEETNVAAIKLALQYCIEAIKTLEGMKLSPELHLQKIEGLKAGVPSIDIYEEVSRRKPMERQAPTFIPPSDYDDLRIERLLKKKGYHGGL
jgi:hypothetical protein